jgi:CheY-like chemotaxis protein
MHTSGSRARARRKAERGQTARRTGNRRIVVVEDDPDVRALWLEHLRDAGYAPVGVGQGDEALRVIASCDPALVVSDVVMPGMDGFDFLARLRSQPAFVHVPVLFVSALAEGVGQTLAEFPAGEMGVAGILSKPVEQRTLVDRVRRAIAGRPASRAGSPARSGTRAG